MILFLFLNASNGKGTEVTISKANLRKQTGSGEPKIGKAGRGDPKIGPRNPPPFIGNWGDKQYGRGCLDMAGPLNTVEEWFVDTVEEKQVQRQRSKGKGSRLDKVPIGAKKYNVSNKKKANDRPKFYETIPMSNFDLLDWGKYLKIPIKNV